MAHTLTLGFLLLYSYLYFSFIIIVIVIAGVISLYSHIFQESCQIQLQPHSIGNSPFDLMFKPWIGKLYGYSIIFTFRLTDEGVRKQTRDS